MLKLLLYAPCERLITAKEGTTSLISIMENFVLTVEEDVPPDSLMPMRWDIVSLWRREEEIEGQIDFEERTDVLRPDGTVATGGTTRFSLSNKNLNFRTTLAVSLFPIGQSGNVLLKMRIRQTNPETEWRDVAEYPILFALHRKENDEATTTENAEAGGVRAISGTDSTPDDSAEEGSGQTEGKV